jgi:hypothetical protein
MSLRNSPYPPNNFAIWRGYIRINQINCVKCTASTFGELPSFVGGLKILTMGAEEQKEEREVLDSIFPDEITGTFAAAANFLKIYL